MDYLFGLISFAIIFYVIGTMITRGGSRPIHIISKKDETVGKKMVFTKTGKPIIIDQNNKRYTDFSIFSTLNKTVVLRPRKIIPLVAVVILVGIVWLSMKK